MKLSFKYRIYPTKAQQKVIQNNFNFRCFLYNSALQERNSYYKKFHKSLSYNKQSAQLPEIIFEKLNIKNMTKDSVEENHKNLVKGITEASWGGFIQKLTYKTERADKKVTPVDPKNTSRTCSNCLHIKESLSLSEREYHCEICNFSMSRDQNAAINIKRLGISLVANHSDLLQNPRH